MRLQGLDLGLGAGGVELVADAGRLGGRDAEDDVDGGLVDEVFGVVFADAGGRADDLGDPGAVGAGDSRRTPLVLVNRVRSLPGEKKLL